MVKACVKFPADCAVFTFSNPCGEGSCLLNNFGFDPGLDHGPIVSDFPVFPDSGVSIKGSGEFNTLEMKKTIYYVFADRIAQNVVEGRKEFD